MAYSRSCEIFSSVTGVESEVGVTHRVMLYRKNRYLMGVVVAASPQAEHTNVVRTETVRRRYSYIHHTGTGTLRCAHRQAGSRHYQYLFSSSCCDASFTTSRHYSFIQGDGCGIDILYFL